MVKLMLLYETDAYNNEDWYINNFSFKSVREADIDYKQLTIESTTQDELFKLIEQYVKPDENSILNITDLYYTKDFVYQSIYKVVESEKSKNYNALGSQLTRTHKVGGNMILFKRSIINESHDFLDFTFDDLHTLIQSTFVHNAIVIHTDGTMEELPFINDVLESTPDKQTFETIRYHEYKFLDYTMLFYCDISVEQIPKNLNKIASTIYRKKIYGRIFITLTDNNDEHPQHINLDKNTINQIYHLHAIEEELDQAKHSKKFDLENQESFPQINYDPNFFSIINLEYIKKENIPQKTDINKFQDVLNNIK